MQDGCKVFLHSMKRIMFHDCLDTFQKSALGGRPSTKTGDMALQMFTTVYLFYFIMCGDPHELKFTEIAFG